jgi:hypothetical protein
VIYNTLITTELNRLFGVATNDAIELDSSQLDELRPLTAGTMTKFRKCTGKSCPGGRFSRHNSLKHKMGGPMKESAHD